VKLRQASSGTVAVRPVPTGPAALPLLADDAPTRDRLVRSILENGPSPVAELAARVGLTSAAVRRHLENLLAEGLLEVRTPHSRGARGRGRPARVFALTDAGRDRFDQAYDDLAATALRYLRDTVGEDAVAAFARERVAQLEARYRALVEAEPEHKATALARALSDDGYAASVEPGRTGDQLCQHHCPVAHVAAEFPALCEAETEVFSRLLGSHVQRLATIAHGDGICTTNIPHPRTDPKESVSR
jgi:predicted ArsR family transcriptional regulator